MQVAQLILLPTLLGKIDSIYQANLIKEIYHKNDNEDWKNILKIYEMNYEVVYNPLTFGPLLSPGLGGAGGGAWRTKLGIDMCDCDWVPFVGMEA